MRHQIQTDEQLVERYLYGPKGESEAAFEAMVKRHGPLVLGVCRQILNHHQDAEDAFQATFLVLARKAATIRDPKLLGCWLYEVACRSALRARSGMARRQFWRKTPLVDEPVARPERAADGIDLREVIHDEINRLPEKYGVPLVLTYLEGETNEEVARLLQWPVGTVKGRLFHARDMLRARLSRRGLRVDQPQFAQRRWRSSPPHELVS
jgi:RNA polymerase sigma factor (sigma-70 family)